MDWLDEGDAKFFLVLAIGSAGFINVLFMNWFIGFILLGLAAWVHERGVGVFQDVKGLWNWFKRDEYEERVEVSDARGAEVRYARGVESMSKEDNDELLRQLTREYEEG